MASFRFRAEAALTFRRDREEEARLALARAEERLRECEAAVRQAEHSLTSDCHRCADEERRATGAHVYEWHRAWILALRQRVAALDQRRAATAVQHQAAAAAWQRARRDVRALERLRERALLRYHADERHREQTELNWLGTLKHTLAARQAQEE